MASATSKQPARQLLTCHTGESVEPACRAGSRYHPYSQKVSRQETDYAEGWISVNHLGCHMLFLFRYVLIHPLKAAAAFWKALSARETLSERQAEAEDHLKALCQAIGLYKFILGHWPSNLEDLCFNNHDDPQWNGPFIEWRGEGTFDDLFGFPYQYSVSDDGYKVRSLGLEAARASVNEEAKK